MCATAALNQVYRTGSPLYDVGSGSGVPGLIFGILRPEVDVQLVEPLTKRVAFLKTAARKLSLDNIKVHRTRWPIESSEAGQVVSRAVIARNLLGLRIRIHPFNRFIDIWQDNGPFEQGNFELTDALDCQRAGGESLRIAMGRTS